MPGIDVTNGVPCVIGQSTHRAVSATIAIPAMWYLATRGIDVGVLAGTDMMGVTMRPIWYGVYNLETIRGPFISLFIIISLAVLYPARKAARLNPVQAMRHR